MYFCWQKCPLPQLLEITKGNIDIQHVCMHTFAFACVCLEQLNHNELEHRIMLDSLLPFEILTYSA